MKTNNQARQIGNFLADILQHKRQNEHAMKPDNSTEKRQPLPNKDQTKPIAEK